MISYELGHALWEPGAVYKFPSSKESALGDCATLPIRVEKIPGGHVYTWDFKCSTPMGDMGRSKNAFVYRGLFKPSRWYHRTDVPQYGTAIVTGKQIGRAHV